MIQSALKQMKLPSSYKFIAIPLLMLCCSMGTYGQTPPKSSKPASGSFVREASKELDMREKLVQLALTNPNYDAAVHKLEAADYQLKKAKTGWLSAISGTYNLNQFNIQGNSQYNNFYPRYNFGLMVPFDIVTRTSNDIKIAKQNVGVAEAEKTLRYREIKAKILTKYEDYLMYQQKLEFQSQITQDERTAFLNAEKSFGEGTIKQEDYNKAYRAYSEEKSKMVELQRNYNVIKIDLEELVGMTMEEVQKLK
jgi:outer membrane protein TolC